jgi:hypothetical protein
MGCKSSVKQIEEEMFMLELKKSRIQEKRVHMMTEFRFETGSQLIRPFIPDYIDHNYMRKIRGLKMFKKFKKEGRIVLEDEINTQRRNEQGMNKKRSYKGLTVSEDGDKEEEGNKNVEIIRRMMEKKEQEKDKEEGNVMGDINDIQKEGEEINVVNDKNNIANGNDNVDNNKNIVNDNHNDDNNCIETHNNDKSNIDKTNNNPNVETKKFNLPSPKKANNDNS